MVCTFRRIRGYISTWRKNKRATYCIPKITSVYGKENVKIKENNILVTIPYNRLELAEYGTTNVPVDVPVDAPVDVPVDASVGASNIITDKVKLLL